LRTGTLALAVVFVQVPLYAAPNYNQAVKDYSAGNYAKALSEFDECRTAYPNNVLVRYYRALCLQSVGHFAQAKDEFQWVYQHGDPRMRAMAQSGMGQLSHVTTQSISAADRTSTITQAQTKELLTQTQSKGKVKKVLDFYADWCGPCQAFAPVFDEVKSHMRDITFERYNVDDEASASVKALYPFHSIPHAVFLDGSGNVLFSGSPARDVESFQQQILQFR
jgi:thiol-disulfide isomerase/thioredoxin